MSALAPARAGAQGIDGEYDLRPYAGVALGAFGLELKDSTGYSQKSTVFGGFAKLGADIGDNLGGELRLGGSASGTKGSTKLTDSFFLSYLVKLQLPLSPEFKGYALLGGTTARFKKSAAGTGNSQTKTGFSYGLGGEYALQDRLSLGAEWIQYWNNVKLGSAFGPDNKAKLWSVTASLSYHF